MSYALLVCLELCSLETGYFPTFVLITVRSVHELSIICFYLLEDFAHISAYTMIFNIREDPLVSYSTAVGAQWCEFRHQQDAFIF